MLITHCDTVALPFSCFVDTPRPTSVRISANLMFENDNAGVIIVHSTASEISGNIIRGGVDGSGVFVGPGNSLLKVKGNIIQQKYRGIHVKNDPDNYGDFGTSTGLEISGNIVQSMDLDGLRIASDSLKSSLIRGNIFSNNAGDRIKVNAFSLVGDDPDCVDNPNPGTPTTGNDANTFQGNIASANGGHDCHDATNGTRTGGTANTWTGTIGLKVNRTGICFPGNQVVVPFDHDPFP